MRKELKDIFLTNFEELQEKISKINISFMTLTIEI